MTTLVSSRLLFEVIKRCKKQRLYQLAHLALLMSVVTMSHAKSLEPKKWCVQDRHKNIMVHNMLR